MLSGRAALLQPGRNLWRLAQAERATLLPDAAPYYDALRKALRNARHSIQIVGWDIDSRTPLAGPSGRVEDGLPETLGPFLSALAERNPDLRIRLLLWDYSVLYAMERELLPVLALRWNTPPNVELCLDDTVPFGASHHQKIVVVDGAIAFAGGLDLTIRRWDTAEHDPDNPLRVDPGGAPYPPFHDVQMLVDGPAAADLAELVRRRWARAACEELPPAPPAPHDPWPEGVAPDFHDIAVGIARTEPATEDRDGHRQPPIREIRQLYLDTIATAERWIYAENQFLTCGTIARAFIRRLKERPELQILLVCPKTHHTWLKHRTMLAGRIRFMRAIRRAGMGGRVRLVFPHVRGTRTEHEVMVHAKVMIIDDRLLRVGSSNLCNRSMGTDTECDLILEAGDEAGRRSVRRVLGRLLGEHLGVSGEAATEALGRHGALFAAVDALNGGDHSLRPIEDGELKRHERVPTLEAAADPHRPIGAEEFFADFAPGNPGGKPWPLLLKALLVLVPVVAIGLLWRYTPMADLVSPSAIRAMLDEGGGWGPFAAIGLFLLLGLLAFPVNVLIIATAAAFGTWPGLGYATGGAMLSAAAMYGLGRRMGPDLLRRFLGPRINRVSQSVARNGIMAVTAIRLLPVAPFTLVNLVAGAMRIRFFDYMAGTFLGLLPGVVLMSALGDRMTRILEFPTVENVALLLGLMVLWAGVTWGLQRLVRHLRHEG
ncbi:VTT domain-containing protein [Roseomonas mucosa]|uniref:VTT domain-containing protein n=1 Tax=Roseomonas mucosa TaxID=207340 RepID=UPI00224533FE|nr:VTT domain-containing protein [Roseomonas mucosa]UZO93795.1 Phospholipase D [Roseomonas mucosa]